jgi:hypothetical protein
MLFYANFGKETVVNFFRQVYVIVTLREINVLGFCALTIRHQNGLSKLDSELSIRLFYQMNCSVLNSGPVRKN